MFGLFDGLKTYLAGVALAVTGLAKILNAVMPLVSGDGTVDAGMLNEGWQMFLAGVAVFGFRHAMAKQ